MALLALAVLRTALGAQPATPSPPIKPPLDQVIIVFKTHFDIGYTDLASNVVQRYRTTMIDDALKVVDQNRTLPPDQQFAWTLPGWPLSKIAGEWPGQTPERQKRVQQAFQEGRFVVHALPFTLHTELLELEDLVRGLGHASLLSRQAGLPLPRDAKMTDVPCHSWILPTLLRQAGVDFLHLGCNAASSSPQVPRLFWWEGPDGSRLLTMYTAESYGTGLVPPVDWPYRTWLALIHTGDNHGPPTPAEVKQLLAQAAQQLPGVKVRIGRLSDFADGILAERAELPVVRGDMPDTWIHGPMCDPQGAALAKNIRPAITTAETLHTLLSGSGLQSRPATDVISRAYEQSLLYGEHTWGGALYWVTRYGSGTKWAYGDAWKAEHEQGRFKGLESSWAEHTTYIETARSLVWPLLEARLLTLTLTSAGQGRKTVVFNPLPWPRSGVVSASFAIAPRTGSGFSLRRVPSGVPLAGALADGVLRFVAESVPALGYATYEVKEGWTGEPASVRIDTNAATVETPAFRLKLDPARAAIGSLVYKPSNREWVDFSAPHGFGQYLYERFDSNQVAAYVKAYVKIKADWAVNELGKPNLPPASEVPYRAATPRNCRITYEQTPISVTATMRSERTPDLPHGVTTTITLYHHQAFVDLAVTIHDKPADPWPEAGWLCLPFKVESPQFRLGRQGSIIDPVKDIVRGANRNLFGINTGVALFDSAGHGFGLCPLDSPLVSLEEPGCWKYSLDFVPRKPTVFINLFNNQWTTNFRLWNRGTWTARVRLWAFDRYEAEPALITPSLEARFPLQAFVGPPEQPPRPVPPTGSWLELSRKGVQVTAFGPNPDGGGTVLRLWELAGQAGSCKVRLPDAMKTAQVQPVDLRGRPTGDRTPVTDGTFDVTLRAFAPSSFVIQN